MNHHQLRHASQHWIVPVESLSTTNLILFEPLVLFIQPFNSTSAPSCAPAWTSPIQNSFAMIGPEAIILQSLALFYDVR